MHERVACTGCHVKPIFTDVGKDCANCHADIHRGQFGANCAQCHTVAGWQVSVQAISQHFNRFPLLGAHAVVQCDACHKNAAAGNYLGLSTACQSCHMADFNATTNPAHAANQTAFPASQCQQCHSNFDSWANASFNHASTGFVLQDAHLTAACVSCHVSNNYNLAGIGQNDCGNSGCHLTNWQQTTNPSHAANATWFPVQNCTQCHNATPITWSGGTFPNHAATGFNLTQGHANLQCTQCHLNNNYALTIAATDCGNSQCHLTTWQQTTTPVHSTSGANFAAANCANCHTPAGWTAAAFDHSVTGFALVGTHLSTPCASCHNGTNPYSLTDANCYDSNCHLKDYNGTTSPVHSQVGYSSATAQCAACHPISTWAQGTFNHPAAFPLTQGHAGVACALCHIGNNYALTTPLSSCGDTNCHLTRWNQTTTPVHSQSGPAFAPANCANCHTPAGWSGAAFDHSVTGFALVGTHLSTPCASCHTGANPYSLTNADCYTSNCHLNNYNTTTAPNHAAVGYSTATAQCAACHPITTWAQGIFNHPAAFPLTQGHANVACALCHIGNNYALTTPLSSCGDTNCHLTTWQQTTTPPHASVAATFSAFAATNCANCHTTALPPFATATWDHGTTGFALTGAHVSGTCISCHIANNYSLGATPCYNCHIAEWNSTTSIAGIPNHITSNFPQDCTLCHSTVNWTTSTFNHSTTGFPLTGAHLTTVTCGQCHTDNYKGTLATTCDGCHDPLYQSTATTVYVPPAPNHVALAYPKTCDSCHTTQAWTGAVFNHATTGFPLTGAHLTKATCAQCHLTAAVPPTDCYSCHTVAWQSTTNLGGGVPNHLAANASVIGITPANCANCHTTTNWLGATFTHNFFSMTHGQNAAGGVCSICHTNTSDYSVFQCIGCHSNQASLANTHRGVGNYAYDSAHCYSCHPNAP